MRTPLPILPRNESSSAFLLGTQGGVYHFCDLDGGTIRTRGIARSSYLSEFSTVSFDCSFARKSGWKPIPPRAPAKITKFENECRGIFVWHKNRMFFTLTETRDTKRCRLLRLKAHCLGQGLYQLHSQLITVNSISEVQFLPCMVVPEYLVINDSFVVYHKICTTHKEGPTQVY